MRKQIDPETRCLPLDEWPEFDRLTWIAAEAPADALDAAQGRALRWKASTKQMIVSGYGRWLGWLDRSGALDSNESPGQRATRDRVAAYRDMLRNAKCADNTIAGRLQQLCNALRVLAPEDDWSWIHRASSRFYSHAKPVRDFDSRMQPPEDILTLGLDLMHGADHDRFRKPCERALMFRDGLLLAFLVLRPLRLANLTSITLDQHLHRCGGGWRLFFDAEETKQNEPIECRWPDNLAGPLERYLKVHREQLLTAAPQGLAPAKALWISQRGTAMGDDAISVQIRDRTKDEFGTAINPHTFRRIASTTIATANPQDVADVMAVLGHSSLAASEKHYNRARMVSAGAALQATIAKLRSETVASAS